MFGDPVTNPMGWEIKELQEVGNVGSSRRVFASEFTENGVPFFRGTEIALLSKGSFTAPKYYIAEEHYEALKAITGVPKIGDLLLPSICAEGEVWMVDIETPFYIKDGRVLWVQIGGKINSLYLRYVLNNKLTEDYQQVASGTTFAEMKIFALKKIKLLVPPLALQNRFAEFVQLADKSKFEIQQGLKQLELQYNALMQKYFG
jgi:type I restriction enzyme S subunit